MTSTLSAPQAAAVAQPDNLAALTRPDFPLLAQTACLGQPLIYLDHAATSQKPRQVLEALQHYYDHDNANVHRGAHQLSARATEGFEGARAKAAAFVGAANPKLAGQFPEYLHRQLSHFKAQGGKKAERENAVMGGAGTATMEALQAIQNENGLSMQTLCLGLPDAFIEHGVHETMLAECGLDAEGISRAIAQLIT